MHDGEAKAVPRDVFFNAFIDANTALGELSHGFITTAGAVVFNRYPRFYSGCSLARVLF